jgi:sigma-E factor negative regulatory protein RseC
MYETGVVLEKYYDGRVMVQVDRASACDGCHARGACQTTLQSRQARFTLFDPIGVQVGQQVRLELEDGAFLRACVHAFVVPLLLLVAAAVAAHVGLERLGYPEWQDAGVALGALTGVACGFWRMRGIEKRLCPSENHRAGRLGVRVGKLLP